MYTVPHLDQTLLDIAAKRRCIQVYLGSIESARLPQLAKPNHGFCMRTAHLLILSLSWSSVTPDGGGNTTYVAHTQSYCPGQSTEVPPY